MEMPEMRQAHPYALGRMPLVWGKDIQKVARITIFFTIEKWRI